MDTKSIKDAFGPAIKEITRRRGATTTDDALPPPSSMPFCLPDQNVALVSFGTSVMAPMPSEPSRPALRVYGFFPTKDDAREHALEVVRPLDKTCSLLTVQRDEWVLMPATIETRDDPERNAQRLGECLQAYRRRQAEEGDAFQKAVRGEIERPPPEATRKRADDEEAEKEEDEAERLVYAPPKRLRAGGEVRGQAAVAMCLVPDGSGGGECLVKLLGCFESVAVATEWARSVASRHITDDDVLVAPTCDWLFPNGTNADGSSVHYRSSELQRIMDACDRNVQGVKDFEEWKKQQEAEETLAPDVSESWSEA